MEYVDEPAPATDWSWLRMHQVSDAPRASDRHAPTAAVVVALVVTVGNAVVDPRGPVPQVPPTAPDSTTVTPGPGCPIRVDRTT